MKSRLALAVAALGVLVALIAGCGGSSASDVADLAPPGSPVFVEGAVRPSGDLKANTDAVTKRIAGIGNLGDFVVSELERSSQEDGEPFDYEKEVEPWLGERAGVFFEKLEGGDLSRPGVIVESTDTGATQEFIDTQVKSSKVPYEESSYEGVDFEVGGKEGNAIGVIGDFLAVGDDERVFKRMVDASSGDSLAGEDRFATAISAASNGSLADVYVDVGGLIEQSGGEIDPQARQILQNAGIDPSEATAVASVIPGSEQVEVQLSSDLGGQKPPSGDASALLGSLPSSAFAAIAVSGFGEQLNEAIDSLDEEGIPGTIPPNQLKKGLKEAGIDLEGIAGSLEDAAVFAVGNSERSLGGALVLTASGSKATEAVANIGLLLRSVQVQGVTALKGGNSGFTVRSPELGDKPLVVAAKKGRVAIGYGVPPTLLALKQASGKTLSDNPTYKEAVSALGGTPIGGFVDGPAALKLAEALVPKSDQGFREAKRFLKSIAYLAIGTGTEGELATAKVIVGLK
jgi:hypothetical protein